MQTAILDQYGRTAVAERSNDIADRGQELVAKFKHELALIRSDRAIADRTNSFQGLVDGLFFGAADGQQSPMTQPFTLASANSYTPITLNRILMSYSYMTQGLIRTFIDQPVDDAFRGGFEVVAPELDPDDLAKLQTELKRVRGRRDNRAFNKRSITALVNFNAGNNLANSDMKVLKKTCYWARLYGGAGVIINTTQDFRKELDVDAINENTPLEFMDADRWELVLSQQNLWDEANPTPFNYYGLPLHSTRVMKMLWAEAPSYIRLRLQGWGMSEIERCIRSVNAYIKFENLLFELLDEAKIDVYKIQGFNTALASDTATQNIHRRVALGNQLKNFQHAITMDSEDDYIQKTLTFTGIPEIYEQLRMNLCSDLKMPMNKLFGTSATGFGGGQDALENYNCIVEGVREDVEPVAIEMVALRCQQLFGFIPEDITLKWKPLRVLSGVEEEQIKTSKSNRTLAWFDRNLFTGQEASEQGKADELFGVETEVLSGDRDVEPAVVTQQSNAEEDRKLAAKTASGPRNNGSRSRPGGASRNGAGS